MNKYLLWILYFIPNMLTMVLGILLNPIAAIFTTQAERTDRVKRLGNKQVTMQRDYLIKPFYWFQTHDNAVDEYWYGLFTGDSIFSCVRNATQEDYDSSWFLRYFCRLLWMYRNISYGFAYNLFGMQLVDSTEIIKEEGTKEKGLWYKYKERTNSWQLQAYIPLLFGIYIDVNIGWKTHDGFPKAMYASRLIALRKR